MSHDRNNPGTGTPAGRDSAAPADEKSRNREGEPGTDGQQDVRTADEEHDRRPKDDPSRAPESGTP